MEALGKGSSKITILCRCYDCIKETLENLFQKQFEAIESFRKPFINLIYTKCVYLFCVIKSHKKKESGGKSYKNNPKQVTKWQ